jgi:uncharacterized membrane protein YbhN (UPF0104 family)
MPRWCRLILQSLLTMGVVGGLVWAVDASALWRALGEAHWEWAAAAVLLLPLNLFLDGWVWARLLAVVEGDFPAPRVAEAVLGGLALGFWTPARLGEYAGRAFAFPDADRWTVSLTVFVQRMADMAVGVTVGLGLLLGVLGSGVLPATGPWLLAAAIGAGTAVVLGLGLLVPRLVHRGAGALGNWASALAARTAVLRRLRPRHRLSVLGGSLARYLVFTGQFVCLGLAVQPAAPVLALAAAVGLTFYAKYLIPSLTLLDLGLREGGAVLFFSVIGLDAATGLSAALLLFVVNVLGPAVLGLPAVARLSLADASANTTPSTEFSSILSRP